MQTERTTESRLTLSVLDFCRRSAGRSARESIEQTVALAELTDDLGYRRFWLAEHHSDDAAHACPEVLMALIASRTNRLRVGAGGILLRYYSPLKVAETFLALEAMFPGRIDLGVARGPGVANAETARALVNGNERELMEGVFERKVMDLVAYLSASEPEAAEHLSVLAARQVIRARPSGVAPPPVWVLGSSLRSIRLAAALHAPYSLTLILRGALSFDRPSIGALRMLLAGDVERRLPARSIAVSLLCAPTEAEAQRRDAEMVHSGFLPANIVGAPRRCAETMQELATRLGVGELLVAAWMDRFEDRANVYRWLAEECDLQYRRSEPRGREA